MTPRVLVVDDDRMTCELIGALLEPEYGVVPVYHSFDRLFQSSLYENVVAAVVDLHLGYGMSGRVVLAYLAEHHPHVRRIAMTAARDNGPASKVEHAERILLKPFGVEELLDAVRR